MRLPGFLTSALAAVLAPVLTRWALIAERRILNEGISLPEPELGFARRLGIERPEEIRVLEIDSIPLPAPRWLLRIGVKLRLPVFAPGGMALGRGIFILPGQWRSLPHELVHVSQYQRLGGILPFMKRYIIGCLRDGYRKSALEVEARERSH